GRLRGGGAVAGAWWLDSAGWRAGSSLVAGRVARARALAHRSPVGWERARLGAAVRASPKERLRAGSAGRAAREAAARRWRPQKPGRSFASLSLFDGIRIAECLAPPLDLHLDAVGVAQLLIDLQR